VVYDNRRDANGLWVQSPDARAVLEYLRAHPDQAMVDQFATNQARLKDQAKRCGFSAEVLSAIEQTRKMGIALRAQ